MSFFRYLRSCLAEALLCFCASSPLCICAVEGFYIPDELLGQAVSVIPPCLIMTVLLFAMSYNKKTAICGTLIFTLSFIVTVAVLATSGSENGYALFYLLVIFLTAAVFLLSRSRTGCILMLTFGIIVITGSTFLQFGRHPLCLVIFMLAGTCLVLVRYYRISMLSNATVKAAIPAHTAISAVVCFIAAALSLLVVQVIIVPLELPTQELKLITELKKLPPLEKMGVSSYIYLLDPDLTSEENQEDNMISNNEGDAREETSPTPDTDQEQEEKSGDSQNQEMSGDDNSASNAISYIAKDYTLIYIIAGIITAVLAVIFGKRLHRRLRTKQVQKKGRTAQVVYFYGYLLKMLMLCGLPPLGADTPAEYSSKLQRKADPFFPEKDMFESLTHSFVEVFYGGEELEESQYEQFLKAYKSFPTVCEKSLGVFRYALVFFRT